MLNVTLASNTGAIWGKIDILNTFTNIFLFFYNIYVLFHSQNSLYTDVCARLCFNPHMVVPFVYGYNMVGVAVTKHDTSCLNP